MHLVTELLSLAGLLVGVSGMDTTFGSRERIIRRQHCQKARCKYFRVLLFRQE